MIKQIVKYESGKYFVRYATELTELAGRQKLGILLVLPVYGTMECIVMIYIASWIAAGVSFLLLWHRDAAHISR